MDALERIVYFASWLQAQIEAAEGHDDVQDLLRQVLDGYLKVFEDYIRVTEDDEE